MEYNYYIQTLISVANDTSSSMRLMIYGSTHALSIFQLESEARYSVGRIDSQCKESLFLALYRWDINLHVCQLDTELEIWEETYRPTLDRVWIRLLAFALTMVFQQLLPTTCH